jgi:hypothetical protein
LPFLEEMTAAAAEGNKPIIIVNAKLTDVPSSAGVMGVRGRQERLDFVSTFEPVYHFRLLYIGAAPYPIMGALRHTWGGPWEVFKRTDFVNETGARDEAFVLAGHFDHEPDAAAITECFRGLNERSASF